MIFLGDIAYPGSIPMINEESHDCFREEPIIANLEGPLVAEAEGFKRERVLFNSIEFFDKVSQLNIRLLNLANNHVMDLGLEELLQTQKELSERDIPHVGAGSSITEAAKSKVVIIDDRSYVFLSFGWEVIECTIASENEAGVNPLEKDHVLKSVVKTRKEYPDSSLNVQFHWNYELERYPQPRHRELAKKVIDLGASLVVGHHPHVVNGIEVYRGQPIVYSLGNWFIPHDYFWAGELKYPEETLDQLAFEWDSQTNKCACHWFTFDPDTNTINFEGSNTLQQDLTIQKLTPFEGMGQDEYEEWFRENRIKKKGLPVYSWGDSEIKVALKNSWVKVRGKCINALLKLGLK